MANFCTNCGAKIGKDDNFCTSCGTKLKNEGNFCINCGARIGKEDKFCTKCGAKIDMPDLKQKKPLLQSVQEAMEKNRERIAKEKEAEERKILKTIDEIFESDEIKSEIRKNNVRQKHVFLIKDRLKYKRIHKREKMSDEEIKYFIKTELENVNKKQKTVIIPKEKEMNRKKTEKTKTVRGGHCDFKCRHCYEEFLDSGGGIVGDFDSEGYTEYYCHLGHSLSFGSFCEDYE